MSQRLYGHHVIFNEDISLRENEAGREKILPKYLKFDSLMEQFYFLNNNLFDTFSIYSYIK